MNMEVKPGYKLTVVGVIPEDWAALAIGHDIDLLTGFPFPSSGYSMSGIRLLRGSNVKRGETDWSENITQHWPSITQEISRYELTNGDLVIAMDGSLVGRSAAQLSSKDLPALLLQRVARIRSSKTFDVNYVAAFIKSDYFAKYSDTVKTVTAIPHISPADILAFIIPTPPTLHEQRAIAAALSDMDALINGLGQLIAKKRDIKQATMQKLLTGQQRLPGFSGEWEARLLGDLVERLEAGTSVKSVDESFRQYGHVESVLKTSAVFNGVFLPFECKKIMPIDLNRATVSPLSNTILISRMNTPDLVGESGYVEDNYPWLFLPDRLWMTHFRKESDINVKWLSYVISSPEYKSKIRADATGSSGSMKNISKGNLLSISILLPSEAEQTAIATVLSDMDKELTTLEARHDKACQLKQGMMQELLTGRVRLV